MRFGLNEAVAGARGEFRRQGETVTPDERMVPFDGRAVGVAEPVDGERGDVVRALQLGALGGGGDNRVDVFAAVV
jgi:hypothetical protein